MDHVVKRALEESPQHSVKFALAFHLLLEMLDAYQGPYGEGPLAHTNAYPHRFLGLALTPADISGRFRNAVRPPCEHASEMPPLQ